MYYGREFCGKALRHPYELYLAINQIKHRNTKVHTPKMNGFCERFHRTVADEFVKIQFRKKIYQSLGELHEGLDQFLEHYNYKRTHQGYRVRGRTPMRAFEDHLEAARKELEKAACCPDIQPPALSPLAIPR